MRPARQSGFSLIEVMMAMVVLAFGILGVMSAFQWSDYGLRQGTIGTRALALAESRLEAKRAAPWQALLADDLDGDGRPDVLMRDDGQVPDKQAGDGLYTARVERDGIVLEWTVRPDRGGLVQAWGSAVITARARYPAGQGRWHDVTVGTLRANPRYVGTR
ncbi:MAG TPA: prepilin-type N-terminal cleavage/methylation domain-containing protein [Nitrospiraceae bacterium]